MISPEMFDRFSRPEIEASGKRLGNSFYHLDGHGALNHLDSILSIEELGGVQWVMGAGQPDAIEWLHIHRKILGAGKKVQLIRRGSVG